MFKSASDMCGHACCWADCPPAGTKGDVQMSNIRRGTPPLELRKTVFQSDHSFTMHTYSQCLVCSQGRAAGDPPPMQLQIEGMCESKIVMVRRARTCITSEAQQCPRQRQVSGRWKGQSHILNPPTPSPPDLICLVGPRRPADAGSHGHRGQSEFSRGTVCRQPPEVRW